MGFLMKLIVVAICSLGVLALMASVARADVYKYRDAQGHIYLTDKPMGKSYRLLRRFRLKGTNPRRKSDTSAAMRQRRASLSPLIEQVAGETQVRPSLLHAVIRAESAYRKDALSNKGAAGLMQLMPATAERYGVHDVYDAQQNIQGGASYLRDLLKMFDHDLRLSLAAYNAGENAVIKYGRQVPPYPETQDYVEKVLAFYNQYQSRDILAQR